jgi:uncharacterized protein YacL
MVTSIWFIRFLAFLALGMCGYFLHPASLPAIYGAAGASLFGALAIAAEFQLKQLSFRRLMGATVGITAALVLAVLASLVAAQVHFAEGSGLRLGIAAIAIVLVYWGAVVGARNGELLTLGGVKSEALDQSGDKVLDTSVIIDGRIADIAETGFLDGVVVIPQFVLRELQMVADSSDSMKRNRGRRGLDVLARIQKMTNVKVRIVEDDYPQIPEVDLKLIEFATIYGAKIVTNDFNLNKVAQLRGVKVLNINDLANALKPIVLPGETMRVFVLKEGKEHNQGVAYLDDGTMVVVDNAKKMISKTIDITVTTVLQTTAGKMIFGKLDERAAVGLERPARREQSAGAG